MEGRAQMRDKFPLLEQLRADAQRVEAEISAPYRHAIDAQKAILSDQAHTIRALQEALAQISHTIGRDIGSKALEALKDDIADDVKRRAIKAMAEAGPQASLVSVVLDTGMIRFSDPRSLERSVFEQYCNQHVAEKMRIEPLSAMPLQETVTLRHVQFYIPAFATHRDIAE